MENCNSGFIFGDLILNLRKLMTRVRYYVRVGCGVRAFGSHWSASVASSQLGHCGEGSNYKFTGVLIPHANAG